MKQDNIPLVDALALALFKERRDKYKNWHDEWKDLTPMVQNDWRDTARVAIDFCEDKLYPAN